MRTRYVPATRSGAGRGGQRVAGDPLSLVGPYLRHDGIEAGDPGRGSQLDVVLDIEVRRVDGNVASLASKVALGERGPFIRSLRLTAEQHDPAVEAVDPQCLCGLRPGQA